MKIGDEGGRGGVAKTVVRGDLFYEWILSNSLFEETTINQKGIKMLECTVKSFSEVLILASTNPQYDKILFIDLPALQNNL